MKRDGSTTTVLGRVVYERSKHEYAFSDALRILKRLLESATRNPAKSSQAKKFPTLSQYLEALYTLSFLYATGVANLVFGPDLVLLLQKVISLLTVPESAQMVADFVRDPTEVQRLREENKRLIQLNSDLVSVISNLRR